MPEMHMTLRWPDGAEGRVYSPSTIIAEHFAPGERIALDAFATRARAALTAASERVRARYGMPCSRAAASLTAIEAEIARQRGADPAPATDTDTVTILALT
ncbi:MAG: MSMEG_0570 family nitrogen starvation response protein [Pseudomonadota bacterium]